MVVDYLLKKSQNKATLKGPAGSLENRVLRTQIPCRWICPPELPPSVQRCSRGQFLCLAEQKMSVFPQLAFKVPTYRNLPDGTLAYSSIGDDIAFLVRLKFLDSVYLVFIHAPRLVHAAVCPR